MAHADTLSPASGIATPTCTATSNFRKPNQPLTSHTISHEGLPLDIAYSRVLIAYRYVFSIPGVGPLVKSIMAGRKELTGWLAKRRYKEAAESAILKLKLRQALTGPQYVLRDLYGRGDLFKMDTPSGPVMRLAQR